jgi:hypothetical protein
VIEIPHEVLSEHLQDRMRGRRVVCAVFTTFQFEPGFFEQEVLPVFFDLNLSQAPAIRLVQLEDSLRASDARIAVYYDANGLITSGGDSAKLDIVRIPVRHRTGIFHSKNVFALVENTDADESGNHPRALLVATMSANLTRAGWWKNVEACHVEEIAERGSSRLRAGLLDYIASMRHRVPAGVDHAALDGIHEFVKQTSQGSFRSINGELQAHFYGGTQSFVEFLIETAGEELRGLNLEVISPFFDEEDESAPLAELVRRLKPSETRVFLPRSDAGAALVPEALYKWVADHDDVKWGALPGALTRTSNSDAAAARNVHAKVYRFFSRQPKREYVVIGSVNLTRPAHQNGGNVESAVLVQTDPARRPEFWLVVDDKKPKEFGWPDDPDGDMAASTSGSRLALRYDWSKTSASAYWDDPNQSPQLQLLSGGVELFTLREIPSRTWHALSEEDAIELKRTLESTSFVEVRGDRAVPVFVLVLEEGMWKKPPMISRLSVHEILKYWSLLSLEQRNEFIGARAAELLGDAALNGLVTKPHRTPVIDSIFERFAGVFHAFECVRDGVNKALQNDNEKEALYRLFGTKHDSLGCLLERVRDEADRDLVDRYVITLCARQLCSELKRTWAEFWRSYSAEANELEVSLDSLGDTLREQLVANDPEGMREFLPWFEQRFLARAREVEVQA